jgi:hypothetical protein
MAAAQTPCVFEGRHVLPYPVTFELVYLHAEFGAIITYPVTPRRCKLPHIWRLWLEPCNAGAFAVELPNSGTGYTYVASSPSGPPTSPCSIRGANTEVHGTQAQKRKEPPFPQTRQWVAEPRATRLDQAAATPWQSPVCPPSHVTAAGPHLYRRWGLCATA